MTVQSPMLASFKVLSRYRWLIQELVVRDLKLRYRGSVLGFGWALLNPLLFMAIYTLVFSVYLRLSIANYPLFLLSGMIPWIWFSGSIQQGTSAIIEGRMYVGKTNFPAAVLVIVPVLSQFVNFLISLPLLVVLAFMTHVKLGAAVLFLPIVVVIQMLLTIGILYLTSTLNVFFRDFQQLIVYVLLSVFYLTPIFYSIASVPANLQSLVMASPFAALALAYQSMFYYNRLPDIASLAYLGALALVVFVAGQQTFARYQDSFGEYL